MKLNHLFEDDLDDQLDGAEEDFAILARSATKTLGHKFNFIKGYGSVTLEMNADDLSFFEADGIEIPYLIFTPFTPKGEHDDQYQYKVSLYNGVQMDGTLYAKLGAAYTAFIELAKTQIAKKKP
jgi:hypothetical protein